MGLQAQLVNIGDSCGYETAMLLLILTLNIYRKNKQQTSSSSIVELDFSGPAVEELLQKK